VDASHREKDTPVTKCNGQRQHVSAPDRFDALVARTRVQDIEHGLAALYGHPTWTSHGPPLDELIATVLSQHTSDSNTERAFASLRARFPTWSAMAEAPVAAVADAIRCGGLANVKAPRIQRILATIAQDEGVHSLDRLRALPMEAARDWLLALPGVGPKTAACVLLFSLGLPAMPVDTHVHRLSRRLGLVGPNVSAEAAHPLLEALIGPDRDTVYALHLNLIQHGRRVCTARSPACARCALADMCPSAFLLPRAREHH
jgi:endonuclease III